MMRDIVFRGKYANKAKYVGGMYPDYGDWIYGDLIRIEKDTASISSDDGHGWFGNYRVIPDTVGQYTGLTDKNGVRIFEGDILSFASETGFFEIRWPEEDARFIAVRPKVEGAPKVVLAAFMFEMGEVVGNVYDNPELLEGGAAP